MFASAHVAAGAVVGMSAARLTSGRWSRAGVALGLGFLSHLAMDAIPHGDYRPFPPSTVSWIVVGEACVMAPILWLVLRRRMVPGWIWPMTGGFLGATLPDLKFPARLFLGSDVAQSVAVHGDRFHYWFHAGRAANVPLGWAIEVATAIGLVALLFAFPRTTNAGASR